MLEEDNIAIQVTQVNQTNSYHIQRGAAMLKEESIAIHIPKFHSDQTTKPHHIERGMHIQKEENIAIQMPQVNFNQTTNLQHIPNTQINHAEVGVSLVCGLSRSSSTESIATCRICHMASSEKLKDSLVSPCRCKGSLQFIHHSCLQKWLEISIIDHKARPCCELCLYHYNCSRKLRIRELKFPRCSGVEKILLSVFILAVLLVLDCVGILVAGFIRNKMPTNTELWIINLTLLLTGMIICGSLAFRAHMLFYELASEFVHLNQYWQIKEYREERDPSI